VTNRLNNHARTRHRLDRGLVSVLVAIVAMCLIAVGCGSSSNDSADAGPTTTSASEKCKETPTASDDGVTADAVNVAVPVINLTGAFTNETFGLRNADDAFSVAQAIAKDINADGGVACRQLNLKLYKVNILDPNQQKASCLDIINDKPFAVIDIGGFTTPASRTCLKDAKILYDASGNGLVNNDELKQWKPYMYMMYPTTDDAARNFVEGAAAQDVFEASKGFKKIGLLLTACNKQTNSTLNDKLQDAGVSASQISTFVFSGCTVNAATEVAQAVQQFKDAGVSHVFLAASTSNGPAFIKQADTLNFKPTYLTSDEANESRSSAWGPSFDGAIAVTSTHQGELGEGTINDERQACNDAIEAGGAKPSTEAKDSMPMSICDSLRLFAAIANAGDVEITRDTFTSRLQKVGTFKSAHLGDADFSAAGTLSGGQTYRAIKYGVDCSCWKLLDTTWQKVK
jgi:hypothetical protein